MSETETREEMIARMKAVTVSREYGSGGGEIAARLARKAGWQLIDHEIVERVAGEMGISEGEVAAFDERVEGLLARILTSMQNIDPIAVAVTPPGVLASGTMSYREALNRVIRATVARGHVVIVGRGAQVLLAARRDVLHVRVVAPLEMRIAYVMRRENLNEVQARARIQNKEHDRTRYLQQEYQRQPEDAHLYDFVVNTALLDLDSAVDLVYLALERKARRLTVPTGELGPVVGLPRYPGQPEDFRVPEG